MKTPIDSKIAAALRRVRVTNLGPTRGATSTLELKAATISQLRASPIMKSDLKPAAVMAKTAAARELLRRG